MGRKLSREDRIALRQARFLGVALSADDYEDLNDVDDETDSQPTQIQTKGGKLDMEKVLANLLAACGIELPTNLAPAEFKRHLYEACMLKIRELTTGKGKGGSSDQPTQANPLIPGGARSGGKIESHFVGSLALIRLENENLKLRKRQSDLEVAGFVPNDPSPGRADEIAATLTRYMGVR